MNKEILLVWDWNGTLINDINITLECINILLKNHRLNSIEKDYYREIFTFPVEQYYKRLGFNFSETSFNKLANKFIDEYQKRMFSAPLFDNVKNLLLHFQDKGFRQVIISAMEQEKLKKTIENKKITQYFEAIFGLSNNYANGKLKIAQNFANMEKINPENIWIIGDTEHDFQIAEKLNWNHVLVANGHQSYRLLASLTSSIVRNLDELRPFFSNF